MGYWDWLADFGQVAGAGAQGAASGRKDEAELGIDQDRLRLTDLALRQRDSMDRANLELDQKKYGLTAPKSRAQSAALGDLLSNVQDVNVGRPAGVPTGNISGGLRPSALGANARAAGEELSRQSLDALMSGKDTTFSPVAPLPTFTPTPIPKASGWEKFLGAAGQGGSLLGSLLGGAKSGSGAEGNISNIIDWFKNRGTGRPEGYTPGNPTDDYLDPTGMIDPNGDPFNWWDEYMNGYDGEAPAGPLPGATGNDGSWDTPPPPIPSYDPYDPFYWY